MSTTTEQPVTLDEYQYQYDWFSGNIPVWEEHLARFAGRQNLTFIEIGSWEGRSAVWLLENILTDESCTLHCIDPWASPIGGTIEAHFDHNMRVALRRGKARLVKHKGWSTDILPTFPKESADFLYVDGSHVAKDVLSDIVLGWRLLSPGGVMICDDYELEQGIEFHDGYETFPVVPLLERPKPAIDAFLQCFEGDYRILYKRWQVLMEKLPASGR